MDFIGAKVGNEALCELADLPVEMKDPSGMIVFTTSAGIMSSTAQTVGLFANGQQAFEVKQEDIGGKSNTPSVCPYLHQSYASPGRTGARINFIDPLNGQHSLLIGSRHNIKSEATVEDNRGVLAVVRWNDLEMNWTGSKKMGDGAGTDVSLLVASDAIFDLLTQQYDLKIAPGVDVALIVILCSCYDSLRTSKVVKLLSDVLGSI